MIDMQKEKIAHEKHLLSQGVDFKYLPNIQYNELENVYELIEWGEEYSEALNEINSSWCTWQAAKAQAVPEGFVLVEKNLIKTLHEELLDHEPDSFVVNRDICELWKQANDRKQCAWVENQDANWETGCGETFVFNDYMLPSEHSFKFCCFCSEEISETVFEEEWDD